MHPVDVYMERYKSMQPEPMVHRIMVLYRCHNVFCVDCKHMLHTDFTGEYHCNRMPSSPDDVDLVTGKIRAKLPEYCSIERGIQGSCGPDGMFWEEREANQ